MSGTLTTDPPVLGDAVAEKSLARLGLPLAAGTAMVYLAAAVLTGRPALYGLAVIAVGASAILAWQLVTNRRFAVAELLLVSIGFAVLAPLQDPILMVVTVPVLVAIGFLAVFSTKRSIAIRVALGCALLIAWSIPWLNRGLTALDVVVVVTVLGGTAAGAFVVFIWADDARIRQEQSLRLLFEASPVAIAENDYTAMGEWLERLRRHGVSDIREYLRTEEGQEGLEEAISQIEATRFNTACLELIGASSHEEANQGYAAARLQEGLRPSMEERVVALWEGRYQMGFDLTGLHLNGRRLDSVFHWAVPLHNGRPDLSRVITTVSDITPRREAEEKLAEALASNQLLVNREKVLATCSRALLLAGGEAGMHIALHSLREAVGADVAILSRTVESPELGPAFEVVAASRSGGSDSGLSVGSVIPQSEWPQATELMARGETSTCREDSNARLAVPIFAGETWRGFLGLEDPEREEWSSEAINLLKVAAPMFGAQWERDQNRRRLEELVKSKDQFVASISHELRTPLSAVLGFAELLTAQKEAIGTADQTEMLEMIASQSQDMADMVEDLLVAARADIGTITIRPQEVFLRAQLEVAVAALRAEHGPIEVKGGPGRCWADPSRTRQIIRNLLTNAIRYGGGDVVAETEQDDDMMVLSVRDGGPGLPSSEWERIFEPYHRAHDGQEQPASVGLGLTVSRQLAGLMGGDLVYSAESGSVFQLRLPAEAPK